MLISMYSGDILKLAASPSRIMSTVAVSMLSAEYWNLRIV